MIFIVNKPDVAGFFKETGLDSLGDNWEKKDSEDAERKPGSWKFISHPIDIKKQVLVQTSKIELSGEGVYGTKLFRKRFDTANALLKVNIWQDKKSIFAIFFRYYDDSNYYAFKFNTRKESTILLVKRVAGVEKVLGKTITSFK